DRLRRHRPLDPSPGGPGRALSENAAAPARQTRGGGRHAGLAASPAGRNGPRLMRLHGIDFTSAPRRGKPIAVASGSPAVGRPVLRVDSIEPLVDFSSFEAWLCRPGPWLAVFDLPFGLPRELLEALGWLAPATLCGAPPGGCERTGADEPLNAGERPGAGEPVSAGKTTAAGAGPADLADDSAWAFAIRRVAALPRPEFVSLLRSFCAARPLGGKFAHRRADGPAGSSPSMKWVNPPVALMLHAATPRLLAAGVCLPGL